MSIFHYLKNKKARLHLAWILIFGFFSISVAGLLFPEFNDISAKISNRDYNGEGLIESIEAICWLLSFIVFVLLFKKCKKDNCIPVVKYWYMFFILLFFVAFGEELSWGQHLFKFKTPEVLEAVNRQKEFNFHNLNISQMMGLDEKHFLYLRLRNFAGILNPLFYLICGLLWFVIPVIKRFKPSLDFFKNLPLPNLDTTVFCGLNIIAYLVIDKLFFDTAEILELSLALTALLFSMNIFDNKNVKQPS